MAAIVALSNAFTDVSIPVAAGELEALGWLPGRSYPAPSWDWRSRLIHGTWTPGGSPANALAAARLLGAECALLGCVGDDALASSYLADLKTRGIRDLLTRSQGPSGVCVLFIHPDGERTSFSQLGVAGQFRIRKERLAGYSIFHTSLYELVANPRSTLQALADAREAGLRTSFDLGCARLIGSHRQLVGQAIDASDWLFANADEAQALCGGSEEQALAALSSRCSLVAIKLGARGSLIQAGEPLRIPACPARVVTTTGAGDAYAGALLFGMASGMDLESCGRLASAVAARVCETTGARLDAHCVPPAWRPR